MKEEIKNPENKESWNFCLIYYIKMMEIYCISYKKYTANENSSAWKIRQNGLLLLSNKLCHLWQDKISFVKNQKLSND